MFTTILIFIIVLGFLVFVHELGHFLVAKKSGMMPEEFGFGFPPRIVGLQKIAGKWKVVGLGKTDPDKTVFSLNWIPFGAFVRIRGENGEVENDPKSFASASWGKRFLTLFAGVGMNILTAWVLISIVLVAGTVVAVGPEKPLFGGRLSKSSVTIAEVLPEGPASQAGLIAGDVVRSLNGQDVVRPEDVKLQLNKTQAQALELTIQRGADVKTLQVSPKATETGFILGVQLVETAVLTYPWYLAPLMGILETGRGLWEIVKGLGLLVSGGVGLSDVAGPAKIAQITGQAADLGFGYLLRFAAFLSLNLAVLNALPFPALDGGRIFFLLVEKVRGKKNNQLVEGYANAIGFVLLLLLVSVVTVNDLRSFEFIKNIFN